MDHTTFPQLPNIFCSAPRSIGWYMLRRFNGAQCNQGGGLQSTIIEQREASSGCFLPGTGHKHVLSVSASPWQRARLNPSQVWRSTPWLKCSGGRSPSLLGSFTPCLGCFCMSLYVCSAGRRARCLVPASKAGPPVVSARILIAWPTRRGSSGAGQVG